MTKTARFYDRVGPPPAGTDIADARAYHVVLLTELETDRARAPDDPARLTDTERGNLSRLARRWGRRATGQDKRWMIRGGHDRGGRLPRDQEDATQPTPPGKTEWEDA